jgi:S-adenosylmethionine hydrolase
MLTTAMLKTRVIALLTDLGKSDAYVGAMKGVILRTTASATIVDITHDITPQGIDQAAYLLWNSYRFFPKGTIFVVVVDPGVGSHRKILCVETADYLFLAPDNGILKYVLKEAGSKRVIAVTNSKYFAENVSSTFHGRDIFAPVAAHLAGGLAAAKLGTTTIPRAGEDWFVEIGREKRIRREGKILHIDHFGNLITNFFMLKDLAPKMRLDVGRQKVTDRYRFYSEARPGVPFLMKGSSSLLEVSLVNGSAAELLQARINQKVVLTQA